MYASDRALARGDHPLFVDMRGARWVDADRYQVMDTAQRYEDWEFPWSLVFGLGAAARYAREVGIDVAHERAFALARRLRDRLAAIDGVRVLDRGANPCAIVTAAIDGMNAEAMVDGLAALRINAAASLGWYGVIDFAEKGVESAVRLSPHYYNTEQEIDDASACIGDLARSAVV
jgi:selenocysteine lyase/cysteine desulfurase